jgi:hypothetical protein
LGCDTEGHCQALPRSVPISAGLEDGKLLNCDPLQPGSCSMETTGSTRGFQWTDMGSSRTVSRWRVRISQVLMADSIHVLGIKDTCWPFVLFPLVAWLVDDRSYISTSWPLINPGTCTKSCGRPVGKFYARCCGLSELTAPVRCALSISLVCHPRFREPSGYQRRLHQHTWQP